MFNNLNIIFLIMTFLGSIISISSTNWFSTWLGLELNMLSFIPIMINNKNSLSTEASIKYFLIQASASSMFIFFCIINTYQNFNYFYFMEMSNISFLIIPLMIKLGSAPFQTWFISVMQSLNWYKCYLLMTMQKIIPLFLMNFMFIKYNFIMIFSILSILIGSIGGLNQISLKKIMAFSSINHLGWMLTINILNKYMCMMYFLMYMYINLFSLTFLNLNSIFSLNQNLPKFDLLSFKISILSLGGLPPFLGFLPKWMIIQNLILNNYFFLTLILMMTTLITLIYYMRLIIKMSIMNFSMQKWLISIFNMKMFMFKSILFISTSSGLIFYNLILF
uniref:NADH-ubiquinone oxidoreductase chain 2 n=1 Tax=Polypsocus corruptus TaxID=239259 RepID=A0A8K1ZG53_9NEOP|nr:NADH dehydrogenase subunit 2 [Polypsocus corruptus]